MKPAPALSLEQVTYSYPGSSAPSVRDLSLAVEPGEFVLLAGGSASGKTTLLRAACGLVPHFHGGRICGEIAVGGLSTRDHGPAELASVVGFTAQDPETQVVSTTVRSELELPLELRGRAPVEIARTVEETALALGLEPLLERPTGSLSGGELQRVAIGAALTARPDLLLLDEPTSQLDPVAADELIGLLRRLNEDWGVTVIAAEHRLDRCLGAVDRVVALGGGEKVFDGPPSEFGEFALAAGPDAGFATAVMELCQSAGLGTAACTVKQARRMIAPLLDPSDAQAAASEAAPGREPPPPQTRPGAGVDPVVQLRGLRISRVIPGGGEPEGGEQRPGEPSPVIRGVDLSLHAGERVVLLGPNGAGKSTLLAGIAGLVEPDSGSVALQGEVALLTQTPDDYLIHETVAAELPGEAGRVALRSVGLGDLDLERDPRDLSGGQRQRLALAIAMAGRGAGGRPPALVALDEPTRGLDRARRRRLAAWADRLAGEGASLLVATHDLEFAAEFADRVILLARGRVIGDGAPEVVLGGGLHFATAVARATDGRAVTPEAGAEIIRAALAQRREVRS